MVCRYFSLPLPPPPPQNTEKRHRKSQRTEQVTFHSRRQTRASSSSPARTDSTTIHRGALWSTCSPASGYMKSSNCGGQTPSDEIIPPQSVCPAHPAPPRGPQQQEQHRTSQEVFVCNQRCSLQGAAWYLRTAGLHADGGFVGLQLERSSASDRHTARITVVLKHTNTCGEFAQMQMAAKTLAHGAGRRCVA